MKHSNNYSKNRTRNIWAVGRNYSEHAKEMNAAIPSSPLIFLKSGNCLNTSSQIQLPHWSNSIHYELELAYLIDDSLNFSHVALALDLTARDSQNEAKKNGTPWTQAKSFTGSCPISPWLSLQDFKNGPLGDSEAFNFELKLNKQIVQKAIATEMLFNPQILLDHLQKYYPVGPQDILLSGTPSGVGALNSSDNLEAHLSLDSRSLLTCIWDVE